MTEAEWSVCADPQKMLRFLGNKVSERKRRLFAVACCWRVADLLTASGKTGLETAEAVYDNRHGPAGTFDSARLAILADALEEAGCTNADILNHLRQSGDHVRGCWAVDALLRRG